MTYSCIYAGARWVGASQEPDFDRCELLDLGEALRATCTDREHARYTVPEEEAASFLRLVFARAHPGLTLAGWAESEYDGDGALTDDAVDALTEGDRDAIVLALWLAHADEIERRMEIER